MTRVKIHDDEHRHPGLTPADLHPALLEPTLESMSFLNEIAERHPKAISLAAGRPYEAFYDINAIPRYLNEFIRYATDTKGWSPNEVRRSLFQYGPTKGIITDLLARHLLVDEQIEADPESIVVTVGAQEAMMTCLMALRTDDRDVVLAADPTYVGLAGAAALTKVPMVPVRHASDGIDLAHLRDQLRAIDSAGRRARAFYVVPDFANPTGATMDLRQRHELLALAAEHDLLVLEDNPYRFFGDSNIRRPTLKALDETRQVVYLGSLSKTAFPGIRIGYALADQLVRRPDGTDGYLADEIAKVKSMVTVNTPPLAQAVAGGLLLEHSFSLTDKNVREFELYRSNRRLLLDSLASTFGEDDSMLVSWNAPEGGFFIVLEVPFVADASALERCAADHEVLWTPMQDFYLADGGARQLRLSCSAIEPAEIPAGVDRLARFITAETARAAASASG